MMENNVILRRNRPGTKAKDWCNWPDESFDEMDSTLSVQQYIQQTIRYDPSNIHLILKMPEGQDEDVWKYEHLRQFCMELNGLAVILQDECHPKTCYQMAATEQWIFLCAAHKQPQECPAIDYIRHTLEGASTLLNSNKYFPSRMDFYFEPQDYPFMELHEPKIEKECYLSELGTSSEEPFPYLNELPNDFGVLEQPTPNPESDTLLVNPNTVMPKMAANTYSTTCKTEPVEPSMQLNSTNSFSNREIDKYFNEALINYSQPSAYANTTNTNIVKIENTDNSTTLLSNFGESYSGFTDQLFDSNFSETATRFDPNDELNFVRRRLNTVTNDSTLSKLRQQHYNRQPFVREPLFPKPAYSYSSLITLALKNSPQGRLRVSEIYNFLCKHFPYFKTAPNGWKNSVRHNLSLNKCFEKIEKPNTGATSQAKGCYWTIISDKVSKMEEEMLKSTRKDPDAIRRALSNPDDMESLERGDFKYQSKPDSASISDEGDYDSADEAADYILDNSDDKTDIATSRPIQIKKRFSFNGFHPEQFSSI